MPDLHEFDEAGDENERAFSCDCKSNKAIILRMMEATQRVIIDHADRQGVNDLHDQQRQQQFHSYLQMTGQLRESEFSEEGSKQLAALIRKWLAEAMEREKG